MSFLDKIDSFFGIIVSIMGQTLFYDIYGFPLIVIVLLFGALYFTLYFNFINVRGCVEGPLMQRENKVSK